MIEAPLALAFTTGMVATVNPCGFAMLPAYLSFFLGIEDERASISRAMVVSLTVTAGFAATFALVGLIVFGIALLAGFDVMVRLPRLERGGRNRDLGSMALFGVSYAVASIGCELPLFLAAM